jgi:hypothetical protein
VERRRGKEGTEVGGEDGEEMEYIERGKVSYWHLLLTLQLHSFVLICY